MVNHHKISFFFETNPCHSVQGSQVFDLQYPVIAVIASKLRSFSGPLGEMVEFLKLTVKKGGLFITEDDGYPMSGKLDFVCPYLFGKPM